MESIREARRASLTLDSITMKTQNMWYEKTEDYAAEHIHVSRRLRDLGARVCRRQSGLHAEQRVRSPSHNTERDHCDYDQVAIKRKHMRGI